MSIFDKNFDSQIKEIKPLSSNGNNIGTTEHEYNHNSSRRLIIKQFNEQSYNGPTQQDFVDRLMIIFESIKGEIIAKHDGNSAAEKIEKLENLKNKVLQDINRDCIIKRLPLDQLIKYEPYVVEQIKKARQHIRLFVATAIPLVQANALQNESTFNAVKKQLEKAEIELTARKGRPDFINVYPSSTPDIMRISEQCVVGDTIIPSTKRDVAKLPNFVEVSIGYREKNKFTRQFSGYRHSSLVPILEDDDFKRNQYTATIAKELFAELAKKQQANKDGVIEISLASLVLLTPIGEHTEPLAYSSRWREKEYRQLQESYNALMMYNGRIIDVVDQDGKTIKVKPTINLINAPSNPLGVFLAQSGMNSAFEAGINAQGMNQFITDAEKYLNNKNAKWTENTNTYTLIKKMTPLKEALRNEYADLDIYLSSDNQNEYTKTLERINAKENEIFSLEKKLIAERKKLFEENKDQIKYYLQKLERPLSDPRKNETRLFEQLYYQTLAMYMDGKIEPMQIGARYLLANQAMGKSVDFYCKSGEDRTGRMQNLVEELCEFSREYQGYPSYSFTTYDIDEKDIVRQQKIATYVSEFSVSRDINGQNVHGARGLQIGNRFGPFSHRINNGLPNESGNTLATLAKEVYNLTEIMKLKLELPMANMLLEKDSIINFKTQLIRADHRTDYEKQKNTIQKSVDEPQPNVKASITNSGSTFEGVNTKPNDLIVATKSYSNAVARLEQDHHGTVCDVTVKDKPNALSDLESCELAMQHVKMLLKPPYVTKNGAIALEGTDSLQVARVHAVLLYFKHNSPSFKNLDIRLKVNSPRPKKASGLLSSQYSNDMAFIKKQLGETFSDLSDHQAELESLIDKHKKMPMLVKFKQKTNLNLVEGDTIEPQTKK